MRQYVRLFFVSLCFVAQFSQAQISPEAVRETRLQNGLLVLIYETHRMPLVSVNLTYHIGSVNDGSEGVTGVAHFLEHMSLRGTKSLSAQEMLNYYQINGGIRSDRLARTGKYFTSYTLNMPENKIEFILKLEADTMQNLSFADFETERKVILSERQRNYESNSIKNLHTYLVAHCFLNDPFRNPVIGWQEDIENVTLEHLKHFYDSYYSPANATLSIVGDVDTPLVLELVEKYFGQIDKNTGAIKNKSEEVEAFPGEVDFVLDREEHPAVEIGFRIERDSEIQPALDIIATVLVKRLSQNDLIASVTANHEYLGGSRVFSITLVPKGEQALSRLKSEVVSEIDSLYVTENELTTVIAKLKTDYFRKLQSNEEIAFNLGKSNAIFGDWQVFVNYVHFLETMTPAIIRELTKKFFTKENRIIGQTS